MFDKSELIGTSLGKYVLEEHLATGAMGAVYRAFDPDLKRKVAVKVMPREDSEDPALLRRFKREARILAALNHPHIVQVHTFGRDRRRGMVYLVMEHVDGETLHDRIFRGPTPWEETLRFMRCMASALNQAHRHEVIHRDLKPANVMVTDHGDIKLLDFGLAKQPSKRKSDTVFGTFLGTPAYASPEQCEGAEVDGRTDIFALGIIAYELLTGQSPIFGGESYQECVDRVCNLELKPLDTLGIEVPENLARLVEGMLAKDPDRRYANCSFLLGAIDDVHAGRAPTPPSRPKESTLILGNSEKQQASELAYEAAGLYNNKQYSRAAELLEQAIELDPHEVAYHRDLGMAYLREKCYAEADRAWRHGLRIDPENLEIQAFRARIPRNFLVTCACGERMRVSHDMVGSIGRCVHCGASVEVRRENINPIRHSS